MKVIVWSGSDGTRVLSLILLFLYDTINLLIKNQLENRTKQHFHIKFPEEKEIVNRTHQVSGYLLFHLSFQDQKGTTFLELSELNQTEFPLFISKYKVHLTSLREIILTREVKSYILILDGINGSYNIVFKQIILIYKVFGKYSMLYIFGYVI